MRVILITSLLLATSGCEQPERYQIVEEAPDLDRFEVLGKDRSGNIYFKFCDDGRAIYASTSSGSIGAVVDQAPECAVLQSPVERR